MPSSPPFHPSASKELPRSAHNKHAATFNSRIMEPMLSGTRKRLRTASFLSEPPPKVSRLSWKSSHQLPESSPTFSRHQPMPWPNSDLPLMSKMMTMPAMTNLIFLHTVSRISARPPCGRHLHRHLPENPLFEAVKRCCRATTMAPICSSSSQTLPRQRESMAGVIKPPAVVTLFHPLPRVDTRVYHHSLPHLAAVSSPTSALPTTNPLTFPILSM